MAVLSPDLKRAALADSLRRCALFEGVPGAELEGIAAFCQLRRLGKGEYLFHEGEPARGFYVVRSGTINIHRLGAGGREQVIHLFREGASFAEVTLASETGYPAEARAVEPSEVVFVPKAEMLAWIKRRPEVALRMLAVMSQHLRLLVSSLDDLRLKDVETRLLNWLVKRCPKRQESRPVRIELDMTKATWAAELGTRGETLSRTLARLRDLKLLKVQGRQLEILKPLELAKMLRTNLGG